jgi:hypothetical protein
LDRKTLGAVAIGILIAVVGGLIVEVVKRRLEDRADVRLVGTLVFSEPEPIASLQARILSNTQGRSVLVPPGEQQTAKAPEDAFAMSLDESLRSFAFRGSSSSIGFWDLTLRNAGSLRADNITVFIPNAFAIEHSDSVDVATRTGFAFSDTDGLKAFAIPAMQPSDSIRIKAWSSGYSVNPKGVSVKHDTGLGTIDIDQYVSSESLLFWPVFFAILASVISKFALDSAFPNIVYRNKEGATMAQFFVLNEEERAELFRQDPSAKNRGGFQNLMLRLQGHYRPGTQEIRVTGEDIDDIQRHAFDYEQGGWEEQLLKIFSRHLGPKLGRQE